jgi:hypothetical protein
MSRTKRGVAHKHYWGQTKKEMREWIDRCPNRDSVWMEKLERDILLHGTESRNYAVGTHEYFNRVNRIGRRIARDQLRPHIVLSEDYDFDDSHYRARYKGVWWDIY